MIRSLHPVTPDGATCGDLESLFRERFPDAPDTHIAALIAQFIEDVPFSAIMTSDGMLIANPSPKHGIPKTVVRIIEDLKTIAGDSYPYFRRSVSS